MTIIEAENLTKRFGDLTAVDHIDLMVEEGEIFGFLGPNGAGKTTTINMLTTLLKPDEGKARVAGFDVVKEPDSVRRSIGIIFQDMTVDRNLTAYENLYIHGKIYGIKGTYLEKRINEVLEFVELSDWKNEVLRKFSGGMIRRLEIARGLMHLPEVLFMDEPTLGLDPQTRIHIWSYIEKLRAEEKITIFLTTHYMEEAEKLCDRVAIIDHGKIIALGKPSELISSIGGEVIEVKMLNPKSALELKNVIEKNGKFSDVHVIKETTVRITTKSASEAIPEIFDIANQKNLKVVEVSYHKPSLEDVFIKLTGRRIREETWSTSDYIRNVMVRRFRR